MENYSLTDIVNETLISDIFYEKDTMFELVERLKTKNQTPTKFLIHSPAEIAFDWFVKHPPHILAKYNSTFEKIFENEWIRHLSKKEDFRDSVVIKKIRSLVAATGSGLSFDFLEKFYQDNKSNLEQINKLEIFLLKAKILEFTDTIDPQEWSEQIKIDDEPEMAAFILYVYRKIDPYKGISCLLTLDENISDKLQGFQPDPVLEQYLFSYLRQSIFNLFQEAEQAVYWKFFSLQSRFQSLWIKDLFESVLNHPALEEIKLKCIQYNTHFSSSTKIDEFEKNFGIN